MRMEAHYVLRKKLTVSAAVNPGQTLLLGKLVDIIGPGDPRPQANFLALMLFVMSLGCLVCYYILGWAMNVIGNVSLPFSSPKNTGS